MSNTRELAWSVSGMTERGVMESDGIQGTEAERSEQVATALVEGYEALVSTARASLGTSRRHRFIEAEDLVHQAALMVLSGSARCDDPDRMIPFLKGTIRRLGNNLARKAGEAPVAHAPDVAAPRLPSWDPFVCLAVREEETRVRELLREVLTPREYEVFRMREEEGRSIMAISEATELTVESAKSCLRDARRKLRERFMATARRRTALRG